MTKFNEIIEKLQELVLKELNTDKPTLDKWNNSAAMLNYLAQHRGLLLQEIELQSKIQQISQTIAIEKHKVGIKQENKQA